jgi:hypothetical protein
MGHCEPCEKLHAKTICHTHKVWGVIIFICSIIFPGITCMVAGVIFNTKHMCYNIIAGIAMVVLIPVLFIGWIWSIYWGYCMMQASS